MSTDRRGARAAPLLACGVAVVFLVALAAFSLLNGGSDPERAARASTAADPDRRPRDTQELIEDLQAQVRAEPGRAVGYSMLGDAYLQRARETGDPGLYQRADSAFGQAMRRDPDELTATIGAGTLALARHDFRAGLLYGLRARRLAPQAVRPFAVVVDAQVELGRYAAARRSLQEMVDRKPNLDSYARVSYFRELEGDLPGAIEAMRLAVSAGGGTLENEAFVQTLLGDLELDGGNVAAARAAYRGALARVPGHPPAEAGLAKVDVARGRLDAAQRRLREVSARLPLPAFVIALADVELALGRNRLAAQDLDLVRVQRTLLEEAGLRPDVDLVLFEADHGSPQRAVRLGRGVMAEAPSVRSEDALGWALTRAGRPARGLRLSLRALRLGSVDPSFHYHAGMAARAVGEPALARRELRRALSLNPAFSPWHAARARRTLRALGGDLVTRRRHRRLALVALGLVLLGAPAASAHPLGNFSVNHLSTVSISSDEVRVHYLLDEAEIPTVRNKRVGRGELVTAKTQAILSGLELTVDGRRVALEAVRPGELAFTTGQAGLDTTRLELALRASVTDPRRVELHDRTFEGRVGLRSIVAEPGEGTAVRTSTPTGDPTRGLTRYPKDVLESPLNRTESSFSVAEGDGTLVAPRAEGGELSSVRDSSGGGFADVFENAADGRGVLLFLLLAALGWGALHALSPGHGKAMVAAYLAGTRGTAKHAVALGLVVTVTHTLGVFALGIVALTLQQFILPEDILPWLTLVSGLLVVLIGAAVLRSRVRWSREHVHSHDHAHPHGHTHPHGHKHSHGHSHMPDEITWRGVLAMGTAAGLIPCPSALVVLLAAVGQNEVALGLLLIVAFSVGLAGTLTALGLGVVYARRLLPRLRFGGRVATVLPAVSAVVIMVAGLALTARAVPGVV